MAVVMNCLTVTCFLAERYDSNQSENALVDVLSLLVILRRCDQQGGQGMKMPLLYQENPVVWQGPDRKMCPDRNVSEIPLKPIDIKGIRRANVYQISCTPEWQISISDYQHVCSKSMQGQFLSPGCWDLGYRCLARQLA